MAGVQGLTVKVCVLGAAGAGKTTLCRALAGSASSSSGGGASSSSASSSSQSDSSAYEPSRGLRIQEVSRQRGPGDEAIKVQLWDVAFDHDAAWRGVLSQDADGVLLVIDPQQPDQERELERLYVGFAQPNSLTVKQCLVVAVGATAGSWPGLRGKLAKLPSGAVSLQPGEAGSQEAAVLLDRLLTGCVAARKDKLERAVVGG